MFDTAILSFFPARRTSQCCPPHLPRFCVGMKTIRVLGFMNNWRNRDKELMKMARIRGIETALLTFIVKSVRELLLDWIEICLVGSLWKDAILMECVEGS